MIFFINININININMSIIILKQPSDIFYKDEGGYANCLTVKIKIIDIIEQKTDILCTLFLLNKQEINKEGMSHTNSINEATPDSLTILNSNLKYHKYIDEFTIKFRINKVTRRVDNKLFKLFIYSSNKTINSVYTNSIEVLSKRNKRKRINSDDDIKTFSQRYSKSHDIDFNHNKLLITMNENILSIQNNINLLLKSYNDLNNLFKLIDKKTNDLINNNKYDLSILNNKLTHILHLLNNNINNNNNNNINNNDINNNNINNNNNNNNPNTFNILNLNSNLNTNYPFNANNNHLFNTNNNLYYYPNINNNNLVKLNTNNLVKNKK